MTHRLFSGEAGCNLFEKIGGWDPITQISCSDHTPLHIAKES